MNLGVEHQLNVVSGAGPLSSQKINSLRAFSAQYELTGALVQCTLHFPSYMGTRRRGSDYGGPVSSQ